MFHVGRVTGKIVFVGQVTSNKTIEESTSLTSDAIDRAKVYPEGGSIAQWLASLLPDPAAPGSIPSVPQKISEEEIVNVG